MGVDTREGGGEFLFIIYITCGDVYIQQVREIFRLGVNAVFQVVVSLLDAGKEFF